MIRNERGPYDVFGRFRDLIGIWHSPIPPYDLEADENNELAKLVICPYCLSVWVGFALSGLHIVNGLAFSGGAIFIEIAHRKLTKE